MQLVIISGRSGSGKSTALHVLEDIGYYCVDNLPVSLLPALTQQLMSGDSETLNNVAVGIDARNLHDQLQRFPEVLADIQSQSAHHAKTKNAVDVHIIYLDADEKTLLKRFSETRRRHPMSGENHSLTEAINDEKTLLEPIAERASMSIDTSVLTIHQLRDLIKSRISEGRAGLSLLFQSFGFKNGIPIDADTVFDVRCLPNPHWIAHLRMQTGCDPEVVEFLQSHENVKSMVDDIKQFLSTWLPSYQSSNRSYVTVAIGCTGGQHRSVYVAESLAEHFATTMPSVQLRHRELVTERVISKK